MKKCIIVAILSSFGSVLLISFFYYYNEEISVEKKAVEETWKPYCFEDLAGGVFPYKWRNIRVGEIVSIEPYLQPLYLAEFDNPDSIPDAILYEYSFSDSNYHYIDSIKCSDLNNFKYKAKKKGRVDLFGYITLNEGYFKGRSYGFRCVLQVGRSDDKPLIGKDDRLLYRFLYFIENLKEKNLVK